jgi:hypothetical protein
LDIAVALKTIPAFLTEDDLEQDLFACLIIFLKIS